MENKNDKKQNAKNKNTPHSISSHYTTLYFITQHYTTLHSTSCSLYISINSWILSRLWFWSKSLDLSCTSLSVVSSTFWFVSFTTQSCSFKFFSAVSTKLKLFFKISLWSFSSLVASSIWNLIKFVSIFVIICGALANLFSIFTLS